MAKVKDNKKPRPEIDKSAVLSQVENFLKSAQDYEVRALQTFLANKTGSDRDTRLGTMVVVARTANVRAIARSINFMDAVLKEGKNSFGDPRKGDIDTYAEALKKVLISYNDVGENIAKTTEDAIKMNVGPQWAIRNYIVETIQEAFELSKNQSEKVFEKFSSDKKVNADLTIEDYIKTVKEEAKKAGTETKEYLGFKKTESQQPAATTQQPAVTAKKEKSQIKDDDKKEAAKTAEEVKTA